MVEAIEDLFVPVLVYNNKQEDADTLKRFQEPSWNNPVTRFLDQSLSDVIPRKDRTWKMGQVAGQMVAALKAVDRPIPKYLKDLVTSQNISASSATFAMHCYWEGEGKLGSIAGVLDTKSAWRDGLEVVELSFDTRRVAYQDLVKAAQSFECASTVFAESKEQLAVARQLVGSKAKTPKSDSRMAKLSDQKYYLRNTPIVRNLPLTRFQSTKINGALNSGSDFKKWLSPRQVEMAKQLSEKPEAWRASFVFPEDDSKLAIYWQKLAAALGHRGN